LGLSATKFNEINKAKSSSLLLKYFANNPTTSKSSFEENADSNSFSSVSKSMSDEIEKTGDSIVSKNLMSLNNEQSSIKKQKTDIMTLLLNQKTMKMAAKLDDESTEKDADSDILLDENDTSNIHNELPIGLKIDEQIDIMKCSTCGKKVLVWEMPEHQDFHYAQTLSKEACAYKENNKRPIETESESGGALINNKDKKSKKMKVEISTLKKTDENNSNKKLIEKYFKKL
jgi:hypothetical protein